MKFTVTKEKVLSGLQAVQNVVTGRSTLPILSNLLIRSRDHILEFTATDLDVTITASVEAEVERQGAVTIPAKKLVGIVRELASPELEFELGERNVCTLQSGASFFRLNGLPAEEFPAVQQVDDHSKVVLPQERLKTMLRRTSFAISTDETRYVLNGTYVSLKDQKIALVATDGRRLALTDEDVELGEEGQAEFIVPGKTIAELNRLLQNQGEVSIQYSGNQAVFCLREEKGLPVWVTTKLVEGTYPNYRQVIPGEFKERITLNREELLHAVRRVEIMTTEKNSSVKLGFSKNSLVLTANSPEVGEARESLAINYKGADLAIAFNPTYLMDPLKALDNDEVFLELSDELSPGVLKINGSFLYVIMPMRMN